MGYLFAAQSRLKISRVRAAGARGTGLRPATRGPHLVALKPLTVESVTLPWILQDMWR